MYYNQLRLSAFGGNGVDNVDDNSNGKPMFFLLQKAAAECKKVDGGSSDGVLVEPQNACKEAALENFLKVVNTYYLYLYLY